MHFFSEYYQCHLRSFLTSSSLIRSHSLLTWFIEREVRILLGVFVSYCRSKKHHLIAHQSFPLIPVSTHSLTAVTMASFPLYCNICPKQPDFSDLSHLLTHIGSKGHLSHYFKARVRSDQEPSIRQQLQTYDDWYERNQLGKLLSQRMAEKDTRAANARNKATKVSCPALAKVDRRATRKRAPACQSSSIIKQEDVLDPRLYQESTFPQEPSNPEVVSPTKLASIHRAYVPPMKGYFKQGENDQSNKTLLPRTGYKIQHNKVADGGVSNDQSERLVLKEEKSIYPDPAKHDSSLMYARMLSRSPSTPSRDVTESFVDEKAREDQGLTEGTRLKGIIWPGMDLFDSASPDAKRRRNQKKSGSILEHLVTTSITVQPTEIIFDTSGALCKMRHISGQVESSPVREAVAPKPKERRPPKAKRPALKEMSTNVPRWNQKPLAARPNIGTTVHSAMQAREFSNQAPPLNDSSLDKGRGYSHLHDPKTNDNTLEWKSLAGINDRKRKEGFKVYDDRETAKQAKTRQSQAPAHTHPPTTPGCPSVHHASGHTEYGYNPNPAHGLQYLNSTFVPPHAPGSNLGFMPDQDIEEPSMQQGNFIRNIPKKTPGKENIEPIVDQAGRIDNAAPQMIFSRPSQRYVVHGYGSPQFFDEPPAHLDFGAFHHPGMFGHTLNPLTYAFHQPLQPQYVPPARYQHVSPPSHLTVSPHRMMTRAGGPSSENDEVSDDATIDDLEAPNDWMYWL